MIRKIIVSSIVALAGLMVIAPASSFALFEAAKEDACAGSQLSASASDCSAGASQEVDSLLATVVNILSVIVGIAAVLIIIVNGLRFITANGDANSVSSARNGVLYAIIGLIIVALAQVIVRFVITKTG